jgi:MoxR-like ATPase
VLRTTQSVTEQVSTVLDGKTILELSQVVRKVPVPEHVARYAVELARRSRPQQPDAPAFIRDFVQWGAGPRASQFLVLAAKARAALAGRLFATAEDVQAAALPVLRHRLKLNFNADAEGLSADRLVQRLVAETPAAGKDQDRGALSGVFRSAHAGPS